MPKAFEYGLENFLRGLSFVGNEGGFQRYSFDPVFSFYLYFLEMNISSLTLFLFKDLRVLLWIFFFLPSCHSEKDEAQSFLSARGVTASSELLVEALNSGDLELVSALIAAEVSPSVRDSLGRTPLMLSAGGVAPSLVSELVQRGAEVEARDLTGRTALSYAVEAGQLDAVLSLIKEGSEVSIPMDTGGSLAAQALRMGRQAAVMLLLDAGVDLNSVGFQGEPLAQIAVEENHVAVLGDLVERGLDLSLVPLQDGLGLLHLALTEGRDEIFRFLLEKGMDPDEENAGGEKLLHVAVGLSRQHSLRYLKDHGASLNALDPQGWSALHLAILAHDYELVDRLLALGVDVNLYSGQQDGSISPLSLAIENNLFPVARLLLSCGASPEDELYQAVKRGGSDGLHLVKILLESGASPSPVRVPLPDSPVGLAVRKGEYEIAKALFEAGASHQVLGVYGQKPLHIAVARGDTQMVKLLLEIGADPNEPFQADVTESFLKLVNTDGIGRWALSKSSSLYPLMLASDSGNVELAQLLLDHGADPKKSAKVHRNRMWPLTFASRRSNVEMMQVILGRKPGRSQVWVKVDLSEQRAYVFKDDVQVYKTRVSTGKSGHRTRKGRFVITNKYRHWNSTIYGSPMPYFQRLSSSDFGFHVGALPGYPASHGCIRMPHLAAKRLFGMTQVGDYVEIVQ